MIPCEICQEPSTCSVVFDDGYKKQVRWYCDFHAKESSCLQEQIPRIWIEPFLRFLRQMIGFIKEENRIPTKEEFNTMGAVGETVSEAFAKGTLIERLNFLESLEEFLKRNGRWPEEAELPVDPF